MEKFVRFDRSLECNNIGCIVGCISQTENASENPAIEAIFVLCDPPL